MDLLKFQNDMENETLETAVNTWEKELNQKEKGSGYDLLTQIYGLKEVVCFLEKKYYGKEDELAEQLEHSGLKEAHARQVKKIATYYHRLSNGGVQRVVSQLIPLWCSMGYEVVLLTDEEPSEEDYELPAGVKRLVLPNCAGIRSGNYEARAEMLEKIIEEEQIDLMVYHAYLGNMLFWDLMMLKGHRIPFVVCTHSVFSRFAMEGYYRTFVKMPFLYRFCDCLLTLSRTDVEFYRGLGIRVTYMPNPVDLSVGREKMASLDSFSMLWMGRISEEKNPAAAVEIAARVIKEVPEAELLIVGKGDEVLTGHLKKRIAELHMEEKILLCGFQKDVERFYQSAAVCISTSRVEGFPCTNIESRLYGLPSVCFDLPYVELYKTDQGLITVPQGDVEGAAEAVISLLKDEKYRKKTGQDARKLVEQFAAFDYAAAWKQVLEGTLTFTEASEDCRTMMETLLRHYKEGLSPHREVIVTQCRKAEAQRTAKLEAEQEKRLEEVRSSHSYRLGHALLWLPGKIRKVFRGKEESGKS